MDLSRELPEAISLNWEDEEWIQPIDYEQLPFRCRLCHEYGHLRRNYPRDNLKTNQATPTPSIPVANDGFIPVKNKRRGKGGGKPLSRMGTLPHEKSQGNSFEALASLEEGEEERVMPMMEDQQEGLSKSPASKEAQQMEGVEEDEGEDMDLRELDLDAIEEECRKKGQGYVSRCQLELLQEAIIRTDAVECLGIDPDA